MKTRLSALLQLTAVALLTLAGASSVSAADDYFLKIDGIPGESQDARHPGEIELGSFSWAVSNSGSTAGGGGAGAGKASFQDFAITARMSKASPRLFLACASGEHIKSALLTVRRAGREQQEYYTIKMEDVLVSRVENSAADGAAPGDAVMFKFSKITWTYRAQKADGTLDTPVAVYWDLKQNKGG